MALSKAKKESNARYDSKTYMQIQLKTRREHCINRRIELAALKHNISKNAYIICAVERALKEDGLTLEEYKAIQGNNENQVDG